MTEQKKSLATSKTIGAAIVTVIAFLAATWLKFPPEICQSIGVIGASLVAIFMRVGIEKNGIAVILPFLLVPLLVGCGPRIGRQYVKADEATLLYAKPIILRSAKNKEIAAKVITSWEGRIAEEKKSWK